MSFAWSHSAWSTFNNCPKQYYHLKIAKDFKQKETEENTEGRRIHDALFRRVLRNVTLPPPYRHMEPTCAKFAAARGEKYGEMKLALNEHLQPVDYLDRKKTHLNSNHI